MYSNYHTLKLLEEDMLSELYYRLYYSLIHIHHYISMSCYHYHIMYLQHCNMNQHYSSRDYYYHRLLLEEYKHYNIILHNLHSLLIDSVCHRNR